MKHLLLTTLQFELILIFSCLAGIPIAVSLWFAKQAYREKRNTGHLTPAEAMTEINHIIDNATSYRELRCVNALISEFEKQQRHRLNREDLNYYVRTIRESLRERNEYIGRLENQLNNMLSTFDMQYNGNNYNQ